MSLSFFLMCLSFSYTFAALLTDFIEYYLEIEPESFVDTKYNKDTLVTQVKKLRNE